MGRGGHAVLRVFCGYCLSIEGVVLYDTATHSGVRGEQLPNRNIFLHICP